ncbi:MAG TPA: post-COAP-1 domain-containing protein [Gaiellaceae bacterium]|nr:post-COAP-1 domain-containing protein [Gaiellaceae bacterium]
MFAALAGQALAVDSFTPNPVVVTLQAGESTTIAKTLHLDALPGAADIIIAIDTTGSMVGAIAQAKAQATALCDDVQAAIPGARFAVFDFRDIPDRPATQGVLILTPVFTSSCAAVQAAIDTMVAGGGGDFAEAYNPVFNDAYSDPVLDASRNPDAVQFLVVLGDAPPHNSPPAAVAPACGNQPPADPGMTSDTEIAGLNANDITLLMINYGGVLACYQQLAGATGGTAVNAGGDLSGEIIDQIEEAAAEVDEVLLVVSGAGCQTPAGLTITFNPPNPPPYGPFTAPVDILFQETITAPTVPGSYSCTVTALVDGTARATQVVTATVTPADPATLELEPPTDTNVVDDEHCVTATVEDAFGNPTPGITVRFSVAGSVNTSGSDTTNAAGEASFCYTGPALPGADVITAYADTDGDNVHDADEPADTATKAWVLGESTAGCKVTYGGRITAANGDKATFGGNAKADGLKGQQQYNDHGPATPMNVHSIDVDAVVCSQDGTQASIFGTATVNGSGSFDYRIDLKDLGEPGSSDTYRIRLSNGYDSGEQTLFGGNVKIH